MDWLTPLDWKRKGKKPINGKGLLCNVRCNGAESASVKPEWPLTAGKWSQNASLRFVIFSRCPSFELTHSLSVGLSSTYSRQISCVFVFFGRSCHRRLGPVCYCVNAERKKLITRGYRCCFLLVIPENLPECKCNVDYLCLSINICVNHNICQTFRPIYFTYYWQVSCHWAQCWVWHLW